MLEGIVKKDSDLIERKVEAKFAEKLITKFENSQELSYQKSENINSFIADAIFVKGISANRSENDTNFDYLYVPEMEELGLRQYTHRYHSGLSHYYQQRDIIQQSLAEIQPEL